MRNKSDELDYIASVMKSKKNEDSKIKSQNINKIWKDNNMNNSNTYKLRSK